MGCRASKTLQIVAVGVLMLCTAGLGQNLDDNCTVSVLNRTVRVNANGSWVLPNIPANFGQVKARATCVRNGVTISGESALFSLILNRMNAIAPISLGSATQVPASLSITPANPSLTAAGQTIQLVVTATYPDNSTANVTAGASGTNYTTSNSAIATVNANGLITAVGSGTVVIQATNDGASGIITASVVLSNVDSDGDGIPDDVEISLGLDPHNAVDAQEDFDRDGLTNLREFQLGSGLRVFDTDGDGIGDGLEVQTGSNPVDPNSFNFAQTLQSIQATPTNIALVVNTIIGEASQQLTVTGTLIDGNIVNLTSRSRGTNYNSSNLSVANFGAVDGLVFAGINGTATITVTNNGFTAPPVQVSVSSFAPTALAALSIPGYANNVDVSGDFAYVAAGATGLQVVSVANRRSPAIVGSLDTPGNANDVRIVGNRAYVADGSAGLRIIDVTNPLSPTLIGTVDTPGEAQDVVVSGTRVYIADGASGLQIVDVSNPSAPVIVGSVDTPGTAKGVDVSGNTAVVADGSPSSAARIIDITNSASPQIVGSIAIPGDAKDLVVRNTEAYVAAFTGGLQIVDFSTATSPRIMGGLPGSSPNGFVPRDVELSGRFALAAEQLFPNVVPIVDVGNPATPLLRTVLNFAPLGDYAGTGIALDANHVYMTGESFIVGPENGTTGNTRLFIGQYLTIEDRAGVPPTVSITSPSAGSTLIEGSTVLLTAQATDDVQVASVNFLLNGAVVFTDSTAPYEFNATVPAGVTMIVGATAVDIGGNVGVATNVSVNVIPDPLTTVIGRVLGEDTLPIAGASLNVLGRTGTTGVDGSFSISNVSTVQGNLIVGATITPPGGTQLTGSSAPTPPVRGGITNVGDIVVLPAAYETNIGTLVLRQDDGSVTRPLPFSFSFYGNPYNQVFVNNNGNITFTSSQGEFEETVAEFLAQQPRISAFWDDLIPDSTFGDTASGLYINDQLPGRLVVTWLRQLEYFQVPGPCTIQVILFSDGRIQYAYRGVASLDALVGLSPGGLTVGNPLARAFDFSSASAITLAAGEAVYEQFEVPAPRGETDPLGSGQNSARDNPFDLDGGFIVFRPNAGGGYDVRTILGQGTSNHGAVTGSVLDANSQAVAGAEVEVSSSRAPSFRARTNTDSQGRYNFPNVPCGGKIILRAKKDGNQVGQGVGEMYDGQGSVTINLRPVASGPPKN